MSLFSRKCIESCIQTFNHAFYLNKYTSLTPVYHSRVHKIYLKALKIKERKKENETTLSNTKCQNFCNANRQLLSK